MSGRKFMTIAFSATYCLVIIGSLVLACMKLMTVAVLLALFSGFTPMVMYIVKSYYNRTRPEEAKNGLKPNSVA